MTNRNIFVKIYNILFGTAVGIILLLAVYYHINIYIFNASNGFVIDECCLVTNSLLPWYKLFQFLPNLQCTPPVFSLITKIIVNTFQLNEQYFRLFPLVITLLSIVLFTILEFKILKNRFGIIFALILFVTNYSLFEYTFFYKQYATDIMLSIILLIFAIKIKNKEYSCKNAFLLGIATCFISLISYTADIVIAGIFLAKILYDKYTNNKVKIKSYICYSLPVFCYLIYLVIFVIIPLKMEGFFYDYWFSDTYAVETLTIQTYSNTIWQNVADVLMTSYPINCNLFILGALLLGALVIFYKTDRFLFYFYITLIPVIILLALLKIYPITPQRVILYLCPLFYILMSKMFDITFYRKKILSLIVFVLFSFLINYNDLYNSFMTKMKNPQCGEGSPAKYYYKLLKHSDFKPTDYICWYIPLEIRLYNFNNTLKIKNANEQIIHQDMLKDIPKGKNIFLYLSDEYYGDYYREYASMKKFIDNECEIQYSIFDDTGSYTGHFIKCKKITESNKE